MRVCAASKLDSVDFDLLFEVASTPCEGDLDGDLIIGLSDLGIILADFGCTSNGAADVDGDGDADLSDLGILLAAFGTNCL